MLLDIAKAALKVLTQHLEAIDGSIAALDKEISATHAQSPVSRLLASIPGVGKIAARAIAACVPDPKVFKSGFPPRSGRRQGQNSSGGKEKRGAIGKQGNRAAARAGATSLVRVAAKCKGAPHAIGWSAFSRASPREESPWRLANKHARINWAMMTRGAAFRTENFERAWARAVDSETLWNFPFGEGEQT